jgi:hypothetical protein
VEKKRYSKNEQHVKLDGTKKGVTLEKGGKRITKGTDRPGTWGPRAPEPKSSNDDRRPGLGPGTGRVKTSIAAGLGGLGHKRGHRRRSARAPAVSTGEVEPRR